MGAGFSYNDDPNQQIADYAPGYVPGSYMDGTMSGASPTKDPNLVDPSYMRPDQSKFERYMEQRGNFFYGGTATGARDSIAAARSNMSPYTGQLNSQGGAYFNNAMAAAGREAPLAQGYLQSDQAGSAGQYGAAGQLVNMAQQGPGPSVAQANLIENRNAAMRQQLALAGSGRGAGGGASAYRQAAANNAAISSQANAQAAALGAQETNDYRNFQAGALSQAGALYGQGRASDMSAAGYMTGAQQGQTQINDQYALGMGGLATGAVQGAGQLQYGTEQLGSQINASALSGSMGYEGNLSQIYGINKGIGVQNAQMDAQRDAATMNMIGTGIGVAASMSDIRAKKNIQPLPTAGGGASKEDEDRAQRERTSRFAQLGGQFGGQFGLAMSDERSKQKIQALEAELAQFKQPSYSPVSYPQLTQPEVQGVQMARAAPGYSYEYKDPSALGAAPGRQEGPMAQDLAKTPAGASAVVEQPNGMLGVDTNRLSLVNTAAVHGQQKQIDTLWSELRQMQADEDAGREPGASSRAKKAFAAAGKSGADYSALDAQLDRIAGGKPQTYPTASYPMPTQPGTYGRR